MNLYLTVHIKDLSGLFISRPYRRSDARKLSLDAQ
jgi:hypothetical protein